MKLIANFIMLSGKLICRFFSKWKKLLLSLLQIMVFIRFKLTNLSFFTMDMYILTKGQRLE